MPWKLTIAVTCTDRKTSTPEPQLLARSLPSEPIDDRAARWSTRVSQASDTRPLRQLYAGETWQQVLRLEGLAKRRGFEPELLVLSAGLGLVSADEHAPSYSATFAHGVADSVGTSATDNRAWWTSVNTQQERSTDLSSGPTILVMSESYANAAVSTILPLAERDDVILFGGSSLVPGAIRVPSDRALRSVLGGTTSSLNVRMASSWLESTESGTTDFKASLDRWRQWASRSRVVESFDRRALSDAEIREFLSAARAADPSITKTRALRLLRDSNMACEQSRFGQLFAEVCTP